MARKDDIAMAVATAKKRVRTRVRMEMAIRADEILNAIMDEVETEVLRLAASRQPYELQPGEAWLAELVEKYYPRQKVTPLLTTLHPPKAGELGE